MKIAVATLESMSPYSQSKHIVDPKLDKELPKDYEARCWRSRIHATADGEVYIPPMSFKNCLAECAKFLGEQIPGKGKSTYTKHFEAGILVPEPVMLGIQKDEVDGEWLFLPSDGKRGGGKRVDKCYPVIPHWKGRCQFLVLDETITADVFNKHLTQAGQFIGIGRFRPRNNGFYGRFSVLGVEWSQ